MRIRITAITIFVLLTFFCLDAYAYVGPGAGITMLGALWAVILAVVFAIGGVLLWPLRAILRKLRKNNSGAEVTEEKQ